ncbi:MAG TPA: APH(3') family aminoglycoside O-phosphotransferase [Paenibacillus sp.]|uniref:APH(3') family aminoglycoside O-phosphotransferase n=1 Tax=Paenibacillus sp. TaxID=58172 RepID=UPI002C3D5A37|nr:APH(3') family aminoglycoside O-phosphotransferase [Paenibacillus sp.]HUC91022.1 APH(3') family aminoglycoside O-phosphotransferase [Paenibacillus sp.]
MRLPQRIAAALPDGFPAWAYEADWTQETVGLSGCQVYRIAAAGQKQTAFVKIASDESLDSDYRVLGWLAGKLPVPEILFFGQSGGSRFLLTTAVPGEHGASAPVLAEPERFVTLYADGLKQIHSVGAGGCPFDRKLDVVLEEAAERVRRGLVNAAHFDAANRGKQPSQLLEELLRTRPPEEDIVFAHGDYCVPNVLIDRSGIGGFVDWGRAGLADRYQDVGIALRSLKYNGLEAWSEIFLERYGITEPDQAKIDYYILLDELF